MASRKKRAYSDYEELGIMLQAIYDNSLKAVVKANSMYPRDHKNYRKVERLYELITDIKCGIDDDYCAEIDQKDIPKGHPIFPIYPRKDGLNVQS